jgi:hypothetical protein
MRLISIILVSGCFIFMPLGSGLAEDKTAATDQRINLGFNEAEKVAFLSEMRQMLVSIQGIISGIGEGDTEKIIRSAQVSGNRMARATPESIRTKTPQSFKEIGGPTHMMFEEMVIRAETDDMESLTVLTGEIMQQCVACHAAYKIH